MKKRLWLYVGLVGLVLMGTSLYISLQDSFCPPVNVLTVKSLEWVGAGLIAIGIWLVYTLRPKHVGLKHKVIAGLWALGSATAVTLIYVYLIAELSVDGIFHCFSVY